MELSKKGAAFVRAHEGFVARYYLCPAGVPTIGVGMTWRSKAFRKWWSTNRSEKFGPGVRITRGEADNALLYLFKHEYGEAVNNWLGNKIIKQHQWDCAASMSYNCGAGALKWKWAQALKAGRITEAATRLRSTAIKAGGRRLAGLVRRRKEEALLLEKGIYSGVHGAQSEPADAMADGVLVRGERGPAVKTLIQALAKLGYYDGTVDDVFGYGTEAAVVEFQRDNGLKADGYAGSQTLKAIESAIRMGDQKADKFQAKVVKLSSTVIKPTPRPTDPFAAEAMAEPTPEPSPVVADAAATGRFSKEKLIAVVGGATVTTSAVSEVAANVQATSNSLGDWFIPIVLTATAGFFGFLWYRRDRRQKRAIAELEKKTGNA